MQRVEAMGVDKIADESMGFGVREKIGIGVARIVHIEVTQEVDERIVLYPLTEKALARCKPPSLEGERVGACGL